MINQIVSKLAPAGRFAPTGKTLLVGVHASPRVSKRAILLALIATVIVLALATAGPKKSTSSAAAAVASSKTVSSPTAKVVGVAELNTGIVRVEWQSNDAANEFVTLVPASGGIPAGFNQAIEVAEAGDSGTYCAHSCTNFSSQHSGEESAKLWFPQRGERVEAQVISQGSPYSVLASFDFKY